MVAIPEILLGVLIGAAVFCVGVWWGACVARHESPFPTIKLRARKETAEPAEPVDRQPLPFNSSVPME